MISITLEDRKEIATKILDLGNLTFGAVALGQAFSNGRFQIIIGVFGIIMWLIFVVVAMIVKKGGKIWITK